MVPQICQVEFTRTFKNLFKKVIGLASQTGVVLARRNVLDSILILLRIGMNLTSEIMNIVVSYKGHDGAFDELIRKIAPQNNGGSGYSFLDGRRDLSFSFKTQSAFESNLKKFKAFAKTNRSKSVRVEFYDPDS